MLSMLLYIYASVEGQMSVIHSNLEFLKVDKLAESVFLPPKIGGKSAKIATKKYDKSG